MELTTSPHLLQDIIQLFLLVFQAGDLDPVFEHSKVAAQELQSLLLVIQLQFFPSLIPAIARIWISDSFDVSVKSTLSFTICTKSVVLAKAMAASS